MFYINASEDEIKYITKIKKEIKELEKEITTLNERSTYIHIIDRTIEKEICELKWRINKKEWIFQEFKKTSMEFKKKNGNRNLVKKIKREETIDKRIKKIKRRSDNTFEIFNDKIKQAKRENAELNLDFFEKTIQNIEDKQIERKKNL